MNTTTQDTYVRARIDSVTKDMATNALADMGLSVSDAIRLLLVRVAHERRLPFAVKVPNKETLEAMAEAERGEGKTFDTIEDFMADLHAED